MKVGVMFPVTIESRAVDGVGRIQAHTALETAACHGPAVTLHFYFVNKVFDALMQVSESVDLIVAQVRNSPKHFLALGSVGGVIGKCHRLPRRAYKSMLRQLVGLFTQYMSFNFERLERPKILITSLNSHFVPHMEPI